MHDQFSLRDSPPLFESRAALRVFIVDDNIAAGESLVRLLRKVGMIAACAHSGAAALDRDLTKYDVFFLDLGMPEMDGYHLAHALRARGITAPLIALTGYGLEGDRRRTREEGFAAHLIKPAGLREIREVLSRVLA